MGQMRLAERRNLLQGSKMSEVQDIALRVIMVQEAIAAGATESAQDELFHAIARSEGRSQGLEEIIQDDAVNLEITDSNYDDPGGYKFSMPKDDIEDVMEALGYGGMINE